MGGTYKVKAMEGPSGHLFFFFNNPDQSRYYILLLKSLVTYDIMHLSAYINLRNDTVDSVILSPK